MLSVAVDNLRVSTLLVAATSSLTVYVLRRDGVDPEWLEWMSESYGTVRIIGGFLTFVLVFRTNVCYSRWWEGRCSWGRICQGSLDMASVSSCWYPADLADRMATFIIVLAHCAKAACRGNTLQSQDESGADLVRRGLLEQDELDDMVRQQGWQVQYCLTVMYSIEREAKMRGHDTPGMERRIQMLSAAFGDAVRVRATGLPYTYDAFLHLFVYLFLFFLPISAAETVSWFTPIITAAVHYVMNMLVTIGSQMEEPFGHDTLDLPLEMYCNNIEAQVKVTAARAAREHLPRELSLPPSARMSQVSQASRFSVRPNSEVSPPSTPRTRAAASLSDPTQDLSPLPEDALVELAAQSSAVNIRVVQRGGSLDGPVPDDIPFELSISSMRAGQARGGVARMLGHMSAGLWRAR